MYFIWCVSVSEKVHKVEIKTERNGKKKMVKKFTLVIHFDII